MSSPAWGDGVGGYILNDSPTSSGMVPGWNVYIQCGIGPVCTCEILRADYEGCFILTGKEMRVYGDIKVKCYREPSNQPKAYGSRVFRTRCGVVPVLSVDSSPLSFSEPAIYGKELKPVEVKILLSNSNSGGKFSNIVFSGSADVTPTASSGMVLTPGNWVPISNFVPAIE